MPTLRMLLVAASLSFAAVAVAPTVAAIQWTGLQNPLYTDCQYTDGMIVCQVCGPYWGPYGWEVYDRERIGGEAGVVKVYYGDDCQPEQMGQS